MEHREHHPAAQVQPDPGDRRGAGRDPVLRARRLRRGPAQGAGPRPDHAAVYDRSDDPVRNARHPAVLRGGRDGHPQHPLGAHPADDRPEHAVRHHVDAFALRADAARPDGGRLHRRRRPLAHLRVDPAAVGAARALLARHPDVPVHLEPVPAGGCAYQRPEQAHDGRRAAVLRGPVPDRRGAAQRGRAAYHGSDDDPVHHPAAVLHPRDAGRLRQGLTRIQDVRLRPPSPCTAAGAHHEL